MNKPFFKPIQFIFLNQLKPNYQLNLIKYISASTNTFKVNTNDATNNKGIDTNLTNISKNNMSRFSDIIFNDDNKKSAKAENISRAMSYYLEKLKERESIIKFKTEEYEIGKRHLARMMGINPQEFDLFDQGHVDKAISYLFPSGLFAPKAKPFLKRPESYYPKSEDAAFEPDGRPFHHLFYTGQSELNQVIYEMTQKLLKLNNEEDSVKLIKSKGKRDRTKIEDAQLNKIDLKGSVWIPQKDLCKLLDTKIDEFNYHKFLILLQKLADHPYSKREENFIKKFVLPFEPPIKLDQVPQLIVDPERKFPYQEASFKLRMANVKVELFEGTGGIKINAPEGEFNILFFESLTHREQLLFPFKVVNRINKFDMNINVNNGGMSVLAKALRYAISKCLCSFVSANDIEKLRLAGLLTLELRVKERKKPGQEGARRKYKWLRR